jgi:hypothetical protein
MKGNLGLERVFKLGDFKSMRVSSDLLDVPAELMLDEEYVALTRLLQLVEVDRAYYQYRVQAGELNELENDEERVKTLLEQEAQIFANIKTRIELINSKEEE